MAQRPQLAGAEQQGLALAAALAVDPAGDVLAQLRGLPAQRINDTQREVISAYNNVVEDGWVLPSSARALVESKQHNPINLLTGSNAQEWLMYYPADSGEAEYTGALEEYGGSQAPALRELLDSTGLGPREKRDLLESGHGFHCPALKLAAAIDRQGSSAFVYNFSRVRPGADALMAYHGAEIPYAFATADSWLPGDATDSKLTAAMLGYWTNFVKTGDPNGVGLPPWPRFDSAPLAYMDLGDTLAAGTGLRREFCTLMNTVWDEKLALLQVSTQ
jgi:para-nitrobenzyl esterase